MEIIYRGCRIEIKKVYEIYKGNNRIASGEIESSEKIEELITRLKLWIDKKK